MRKRFILLLVCAVMLFSAALTEEKGVTLTLAEQMLSALQTGDEEAALQMMTVNMQRALKGKIKLIWGQLENAYGKFEEAVSSTETEVDGYTAVETLLKFQNGWLTQRISIDQDNKVAGLFINPASAPADAREDGLPGGLVERDITVTADPRYPLPGTLTLPENEIKAGFVLVHGSGPNDRDETISANKPFRDLAWGLAKEGFAVLRYDKRTYAHGAAMQDSGDLVKLTVDEETAFDAAAAVKELLKQPEMAGKKVFIIGHSMGGMLASYIGSLAQETSGYALLSGTPRKFWELSLEQNLKALSDMPKEEADPYRPMLEAEKQKAENLLSLSDKEALKPENAVLGMSAWYLRHWERIDAIKLHIEDKKPVLVLQGGKDRQVTMTDFELWKAGLSKHPDAVFISYPDLNHIFGRYEGAEVPIKQLIQVEYAQRTPVSEQVIKDIAAWAEARI